MDSYLVWTPGDNDAEIIAAPFERNAVAEHPRAKPGRRLNAVKIPTPWTSYVIDEDDIAVKVAP